MNQTRKKKSGCMALLVVDVQWGLFQRATPMYHPEEVLANINILVDQAHRDGVPVIYVQHANEGTLVRGSDLWQLHPAIQPLEHEQIVHKRRPNAFDETSLDQELRARGVQQLIITGMLTQGCVRATCIGAHELGYQVILVEDGHSNFSKRALWIIRYWNRTLKESGIVTLKAAAEIHF
ncbi:MAG: isochorismatase family cysteine hydrolase [bacterium]